MRILQNNWRLILASNSPRRKELLEGIDVEFEIRVLPQIDETYPESLPVEEIGEYLARKKATSYLPDLKNNELLITADTVVLLNDRILEKPVDAEDAKRMLKILSGKTHRVITGVCLSTKNKQVSFLDTAHVTFGELLDEEIDYYVSTYMPMDKAGSYGVQEWIGYVGVKRIEGSYYNVMGLPIYKLYKALKSF